MPRFDFLGELSNGKTVRGIVSGVSSEQAKYKLRKQGVKVLELNAKRGQGMDSLKGGGISKKDIVVFTRQFAVMQDAGMGLVDTFEILSKQSRTVKLQDMIMALKNKIQEGASLAEALEKYPQHFNELYVSMIRAGEMSGTLAQVLDRLSGYLEKAAKLAGQVKTALIYPAIVLTVAFGIIWGLLVFVVPVFQKVFEAQAGGLPLPTQILVNASQIVRDNIVATIGGLIVLGIIFRATLKTEAGRYRFDSFMLKVPLIGNIVHKVSVSRFTTTLGSLMTSGVPIVDGLGLAGRASGNKVVQEAVKRAAADVIEGKPLAFSLEKTKLFPIMVINMVRVGEETGALDRMLNKVNDFYEDEVDQSIKGLTAAIEPLLIVGLGSIIAAFVIAMYLPVFQMATAMGN